MKKLFFAILCLVATQVGFSQSPLGPGGTQLNLGVGFNNADGLPIYAGVDFGVANNITVGPQAAFSDNLFSIGGNVNYHFDEVLNLPSVWNLYGGASLNYVNFKNNNSNNDGDVDLGLQLGGRYFVSPKIAINLEGGGGTELSGGKAGVTFLLR